MKARSDLQTMGDVDVCIVGSGIAALGVALSLPSSIKILIVEAGGEETSKQSQDFYRGHVEDLTVHPRLESYRRRVLGGTSKIWGGRAIMLDPIDFETRAWVPHSGWPMGYQDLLPFYGPAIDMLDAGPLEFDATRAVPNEQGELVRGLDDDEVATTFERFSKPTDVWKKYRDQVLASQHIRLVTKCAATGIRLTPDRASVDYIEVHGPDNRRQQVRSRVFVLAAGALETPRLLLASCQDIAEGVGNQYGNVGRFYQSHLSASVGLAELNADASHINQDYSLDTAGVYVRRRLWLTEKAQRDHRLLNTTFRTYIAEPSDPRHRDAILSAVYLAKNLVQYEYSRKLGILPMTPSRVMTHVLNIARDPFRLLCFSQGWIRKRVLAERKLPSVVIHSPEGAYPIEFHAEQAPNPDSRVRLSDEVDPFGVPRLDVRWQVTDLDVASVVASYRKLSERLAQTGLGHLSFDERELADRVRHSSLVGGHHIGTTRMGDDPKSSVVNRDTAVHGLTNLYVSGAAVFPTSGQANPTLTLLALALRLGHHLSGKLDAR